MARISKILLMFAAFALVACGDEIDTAKTVNDPNMDILAVGESIDQLPCDASNEGKFVYVADSSEVYFCMDGEWIRFNGKDGTDGSDGKDGKDGTDGKDATNGTDGTKCDVLGFEDGFTVVCGKSNVSINLKNLMPDTCAISDETENGFKVTCGKDSVWQKAGKDAREPVRCTINDAGDGSALFVCGSDTVVVARAMCKGIPYDPAESFCYNGEVVERCGGEIYDLDSMFCYYGTLMENCSGTSYDPTIRFCSHGMLELMCGIQTFDVETEFCEDYRIFPICEGIRYDTRLKFCGEDKMIHLKCGGREFNPYTQFCDNRIVYDFCGRVPYTPATEFCENKHVYSKCGTKNGYDPSEYECINGVLYGLCKGVRYNVKTQLCVNGSIVDVCGSGSLISSDDYFCVDGVVYPKCNGKKYDVQVKACLNGTLIDICGGIPYDPADYVCENGALTELCGGKKFNPETQFCVNRVIYDKCGGEIFSHQENGYCKDGSYYFDVGNTHYFVDMRDNHIYQYVYTGKVSWMVDFLSFDYPAMETKCPEDEENLCYSRGRLYTWAAAMDSVGLYSKDGLGCGYGKSCSIPAKVRGICPSGWRLPSVSDSYSSGALSAYPEARALTLNGPGHWEGSFCHYGCSRMWQSSQTSSFYARYIYEPSLSSSTPGFSSRYMGKNVYTGIRCVRDN